MIIYNKKDKYLVIPLGLGNLNAAGGGGDCDGVYEDGYNEGVNDGYDNGFTQGVVAGKEEGLTEGYNNGYTEGKADGIAEGYENGFEAGKNEYIDELEDLMVTRNGVYSNFINDGSRIPYKTVVVEVPQIVQGDNRWFDGTVDAVGLRAIGWDDEDISMLQDNVNFYSWANDDWKVSYDNRQLYGVMTAENHNDYYNRAIFCPKFDTSAVTDMHNYFGYTGSQFSYTKGFPKFDTSAVTNMNSMFEGCTSLTTIPLLDTSNVTNMTGLFDECTALTSIPLLNTSNVTNMEYMFEGCTSLTTIPLLNTSNVTDMDGLFDGCVRLASIPALNTSKVTSMNRMLYTCINLKSLPEFDASSLTSIINFFGYMDMNNLTQVGGWRNLKCNWDDGYGLDRCPNIDISSMKDVLSYLYDFTGNGETPTTSQGTLRINRVHLENADLQGYIEDAIAKGWTILS